MAWPHAPSRSPRASARSGTRAASIAVQPKWAEPLRRLCRRPSRSRGRILSRAASKASSRGLPKGLDTALAACETAGTVAPAAKAGQIALSARQLRARFLGGSADLSHSNLTVHKGLRCRSATRSPAIQVLWGVREFGMGAIANGIALHGRFIPFSTFLVFSDYA